MNMKRSLLIGATFATVAFGSGGLAMAAAGTSTSSDGTSLAQKIASKFNLKASDVQTVIDADHTARHAQKEADAKARLAQAVKDGKLTQAQADHIQSVRDEVATLMGTSNPRDASSTVRDQIKAKTDALRAWATEQNIDTQYVSDGHGKGGFGGRRDGADDSTSSSSSSSSN